MQAAFSPGTATAQPVRLSWTGAGGGPVTGYLLTLYARNPATGDLQVLARVTLPAGARTYTWPGTGPGYRLTPGLQVQASVVARGPGGAGVAAISARITLVR